MPKLKKNIKIGGMNKKTKDILDSLLPRMDETQQRSMLRQVARIADAESRKEAVQDPIAKIPVA